MVRIINSKNQLPGEEMAALASEGLEHRVNEHLIGKGLFFLLWGR